jgi:hypothetical protein
MGKQYPAFIVEDSISFKKGQLLESYKKVDEGIEDAEGNFLIEGSYVVLTENLSREDEEKIREMIKMAIKGLLWNMYTKSAVLISR